jgi:hypothetical protein
LRTVRPISDPADPRPAWGLWDLFGWTLLAASTAAYFGAIVFPTVVPRISFPVLTALLLAGMFPAFIGVDVARRDPVAFLSIAVPAGVLAIAAFVVPRVAGFWLDIAAIAFVLSFPFGSPVVWRSWARLVLRRPIMPMKARLRLAYHAVVEEAKRADLTDAEFRHLRRDIGGLDRFRTPETADFLDDAQGELLDWANGYVLPDEQADERGHRIADAGDRLWPPAPTAPSRDIPER